MTRLERINIRSALLGSFFGFVLAVIVAHYARYLVWWLQ